MISRACYVLGFSHQATVLRRPSMWWVVLEIVGGGTVSLLVRFFGEVLVQLEEGDFLGSLPLGSSASFYLL